MTLIVSWIGVDDKKDGPKIASIYIATDSRITWEESVNYDMGNKIFGMKQHPDIFGFCGDVTFPTIEINRIIEMADNGILFTEQMKSNEKFEIVKKILDDALKKYPIQKLAEGTFKILHASRDNYYDFQCNQISWTKGMGKTIATKIDLPSYSGVIFSAGSGKIEFENHYNKWKVSNHNNYRTSRSVYHCFEEALSNINDRRCGGVPQLVGLYRKGNARFFGIIKGSKRYFLGKEVTENIDSLQKIEWRNELFERYNPVDLKLIEGSQRQPK